MGNANSDESIADSTPGRQAQIYNETVGRVMKSYLVTEVELSSLSQCENNRLFGFAIGGFMASIAVAMLIEWQVNDWTPGVWAASAFGFAAVCFFGWGIKAWCDRRTVLDRIVNAPRPNDPNARSGGSHQDE